jgi:hypothetical protein
VFDAKANTLEKIRRAPVAEDESTSEGDDLLQIGWSTNGAMVHVPYELTVRVYSREASDLINGLLLSTNCYLLKSIDISPSGTAAQTSTTTSGTRRFSSTSRRTGGDASSSAVEANPSKPTTLVSDGGLRMVILLDVVTTKSN